MHLCRLCIGGDRLPIWTVAKGTSRFGTRALLANATLTDNHPLQGVRARGGVAPEVAVGRGCGHRVLPALRAQRDRRAHVHAAQHVQGAHRVPHSGMLLSCTPADMLATSVLMCGSGGPPLRRGLLRSQPLQQYHLDVFTAVSETSTEAVWQE